jgi:hypothetical protein
VDVFDKAQIGSLLYYGAIPLLAISVYRFGLTLSRFSAEDQALLSTIRQSLLRRVAFYGSLALVIFAPWTTLRVILIVGLAVQAVVNAWNYQREIQALRFERSAQRRVVSCALLSDLLFVVWAVGSVLRDA